MNSDGTGQTRLTHNEAHDFAAAWSPNGRQIAFTRARDDEDLEIYVMDADGGNQRNLTHHPALDSDPDGHRMDRRLRSQANGLMDLAFS